MTKLYFRALLTILSKEVKRVLRIWPQTLLPSAVTTTLYFLIFGNIIGSRIGEIQNVPYMAFIFPGLIMMAVITNSYGNVSGSFFGSKFQHYVEVILVAPVPNWVILSGYVLGGMTRGLMVGTIISIVSLVFVRIVPFNIMLVLLVVLLSSMIFSLIGFINAMMAEKFDDISIIPNFALTPLTYLGGVFYSIDMLPQPFRNISFGNPILYMINSFRYSLLGISDFPVGTSISLMAVFALVFASIALWMLKRGKGLKA